MPALVMERCASAEACRSDEKSKLLDIINFNMNYGVICDRISWLILICEVDGSIIILTITAAVAGY